MEKDEEAMAAQSHKSFGKIVKHCLESDSTGMGFLFTKVDPSVLDAVGDYPCFLVDYCLQRCLDESYKSAGITQNVIFYSAAIKRIMTIVQDFSHVLPSESQQRVVDYVFRSWDFTAEVVCHEAVEIFTMLLSNHSLECVDCRARRGCTWSDSLAKQLFNGESKCRSRFKCLFILLQTYSTYKKLVDEAQLEELYSLMGNPTLSIVISDILSFDLMECSARWHLHVTHILKCLASELPNVRFAVKDRLLPKLIKTKIIKDEFLPQVMERMKETPLQFHCLDSLLSVSRFLILSHKRCDSYKFWDDYIPLNTMRYAVLHSSVEVRLTAWTLLCEHPKRTHVPTVEDMRLIRAFLVTNMTEQSPAIRHKIIAGLRKILSRIAEKTEQDLKGKGSDSAGVEVYNDFLRDVLSLAFESLANGANFPRRMMALSILQCFYVEDALQPSGKRLFLDQLSLTSTITHERYAALVACLDDSFQLCQITALNILRHLTVNKDFDFERYRRETFEMMNSIRSHNTLAAGYRMQFYTSCHPESTKDLLKSLVDVGEKNCRAAKESLINIIHNSIHPWMNTIALLLENSDFSRMSKDELEWWTQCIKEHIIPLCFNVADVVTPAVHSMSPEGYIPEETLMQMTSSSTNGNYVQLAAEVSQLLLACCWRAHKHVSAILAWAVVKLCPLSILPSEVVHRIGEFYWLQLTECKHCGAFETAVEGFSSLCAYLWRSDDSSLPKPGDWLREILDALEGKKDLQNLCSTRRSAGVPHLVTTILATEPPTTFSESLKGAMDSLLDMSSKSVIYRIHSLNVLKAVFSSAALGDRITPALEWACRVAINGCSASTWPERNAAAQLAASLRARIFGVSHKTQRDLHVDSKNRQSAYEFFSRFPSLYGYLYEQLNASKDEFSVYPTLIFLTHLFPSSAGIAVVVDGNESCKATRNFPLAPFILALLRVLLWCRAEKLRRLTVAALVAIATPKDVLFVLEWIVNADLSNVRQNHVHAVLLLITSIVETDTRSQATKTIRDYLVKLNKSGCWLKWCDMNKNLFLILCNDLDIAYDISLNSKDLVLTKRPLACAIVRSGNKCEEHLSADLGLRLEIYRHLQMSGAPNEFFKFIRDFAVKDLKSSRVERDVACILDLFHLNRGFLSPRKKDIAECLSRRIAEEWRMPETKSLAYRLLVYVSEDSVSSTDELRWLQSCVCTEEELPKRIALEVGTYRLKQKEDSRLVCVLSSLLQDDTLNIREEASLLLSRLLLKNDRVLNPGVCHRLIVENMPPSEWNSWDNNADQLEVVEEAAEVLFDSCSVNPYAERRVFGSFGEVKSMVAELSGETL